VNIQAVLVTSNNSVIQCDVIFIVGRLELAICFIWLCGKVSVLSNGLIFILLEKHTSFKKLFILMSEKSISSAVNFGLKY